MFLKNLESLRGIAALMVALSHCLLVLSVGSFDNIWFTRFPELEGAQAWVTRSLLVPFNGGAAVIVFFVLSGYVLGLSLDKYALDLKRTAGFYAKRIFRLYPAHIVVLVPIVAALSWFFEYRVFEAGSEWFAQWYQAGIDAERIWKNATLAWVDLNHIAWSLQVELAGSLFLPLFYLAGRRLPLAANLLVFAALVYLSWSSSNLYLIFLYCFYGGLILPQLHLRLEPVTSGRNGLAWLIAGMVILCTGYTLAGPDSLFGRVLIESVGGMMIILWLTDRRNDGRWFNRFLAHELINRLGRYSYSFYLLHFAILYALSCFMLSFVPSEVLSALPLLFGVVLMALSVPLTFWLAGLSYHCVEVPMVRIGKRLVGDAG